MCSVAWGELRALQTGHAGDMPTVDFDEFTVLACTKSDGSAGPLGFTAVGGPSRLAPDPEALHKDSIARRTIILRAFRSSMYPPPRLCATTYSAALAARIGGTTEVSKRPSAGTSVVESGLRGYPGTRVLTVGVRLVGMQRSIARHTNKPAPTATLRSGGSRRKSAQRVRG